MTGKHSKFTCLGLLYWGAQLNMVTPRTDTRLFDNNHFLPNFSHGTLVPSPNHCSLLPICPTSSQELSRLVPGEDGPMMKLLHQQCVGIIPPFPKPGAGILQSFQRLLGWPHSPTYLHGDVIPRGQALADGRQRGLLDVSDAPVDAVDGEVTLSLSRGLVPRRDRASWTQALWSASSTTCSSTSGPGTPVYFPSHSDALASESLTFAWQCFSAEPRHFFI